MLRFSGFELDRHRAELRGPDGAVIRVRPRSLEMLKLFAANAGRVLGKQELMTAVWPDVHVGEDSLFQSIRELRTALGDERRQVIKLMSGRGYLFVAEVTDTTDTGAPEDASPATAPGTQNPLAPVTIAVMPLAADGDPQAARMAAGVTNDLTDGLAKIETLRVVVASAAQDAGYVVSGELEQADAAWHLRARMTEPATGAVKWTMSLPVDRTDADAGYQRTRLAAGIGHALALRLNALRNADGRADDAVAAAGARVAIEQATASINQTTLERFHAAQAMLQKALAEDPGNVDLQVALAGFQLRGIQMAWLPADERATIENGIEAMMARALRAHPDYIPVLETHCRFLVATNHFIEGLVACGKVLARNPWDGVALHLTGLSQIFLGRFDDALATFRQADRFDTPPVARWTWALGAGWACMMMGRAEQALPWLQRSIAITPATGRTHLLLAAACQQLGRAGEARAAMAKALEIRPGSTARNAPPPTHNTSPVYRKAAERVMRLMVAAGLPET